MEITGTKGEEYLLGRGFTKELIAEMGISYDAETESIVQSLEVLRRSRESR